MKKSKESGVTLVELLAVLVLISLVTGIIWTTLTISVKHNNIETSKLQLQQEANFIITKLQQIHREKECYRLVIEKSEIRILNCEADDVIFNEVITSDFQYSPLMNEEYKPKKQNVDFNLLVSDPNNKKLTVSVPTKITRYKSE